MTTVLIGTSVAVVVDHGELCIVEPSTGVNVAQHELGAPGLRRSSMTTTTVPARHPAAGGDPKAMLDNSSAHSAPTHKHSWSALLRSATPASVRSWRLCSPLALFTVTRR